jgi:hypothetical protein
VPLERRAERLQELQYLDGGLIVQSERQAQQG